MNLTSVEIQNFHCYKQATFPFTKETTVLIGKNGSGKSSLIKAITNGLSVFFSNNSWGYQSLAQTVSDLKVANMGVREVWHDEKMIPAEYVEIKLNAEYCGSALPEWSFYKQARANANLQNSKYKDAYLAFRSRSEDVSYLPLFVFYSDRFPHIDAKLSTTIRDMLDNDLKFEPSWAYYHWDNERSCAEIWQKRFMRVFRLHSYYTLQSFEPDADQESVNSKIELYKKELDFVGSFLKKFSNNEDEQLSDHSETFKIQNVYVDGVEKPYIVIDFADGHRTRWDELPAGYERLFNIVFDLAYRSYILNGSDHEVEGVVFIDELDLHLHPSMEQDVLRRFRMAFPKIQLIASTHSPLIISNFRQNENNSIIQMTYKDGVYDHHIVGDIFGMDYDMTLSAVMGTEPRNVYLRLLQEKYVRLAKREKMDKAQEVLDEIQKLVSENRFNELKADLDMALQQVL